MSGNSEPINNVEFEFDPGKRTKRKRKRLLAEDKNPEQLNATLPSHSEHVPEQRVPVQVSFSNQHTLDTPTNPTVTGIGTTQRSRGREEMVHDQETSSNSE
jgi:hypothetical protein